MTQPTIEQLQAQIAALQKQLARTQSGSGALAVGAGNAVAGERGVAVAGDFHGDIYIGTPPRNDAEAVALYRRLLVRACRQLPLRGMHFGASDPGSGEKQLDLDQVYVGLDTTSRATEVVFKEWDWSDSISKSSTRRPPPADESGFVGTRESRERTVSVLEAVIKTPRVVVLGDPGSGKSTFVNHLSLCLALHGLEPANHWGDRLVGWPATEARLLPISVILRDFVRTLPAKPTEADPATLLDFITSRLQRQKLEAAAAPLEKALEAGEAIVLLDGLD